MAIVNNHEPFNFYNHAPFLCSDKVEAAKKIDAFKKAVEEEKEWAEQQDLFNMLIQGIDLEKLLIETFRED